MLIVVINALRCFFLLKPSQTYRVFYDQAPVIIVRNGIVILYNRIRRGGRTGNALTLRLPFLNFKYNEPQRKSIGSDERWYR